MSTDRYSTMTPAEINRAIAIKQGFTSPDTYPQCDFIPDWCEEWAPAMALAEEMSANNWSWALGHHAMPMPAALWFSCGAGMSQPHQIVEGDHTPRCIAIAYLLYRDATDAGEGHHGS